MNKRGPHLRFQKFPPEKSSTLKPQKVISEGYKFRSVKPTYFLAAAIISGVVCIFALRANNEHMVGLRDEVYAADKNNGDVQTALQNLRNYVYAHMNTDLTTGNGSVYPPIQLKYTYDRLVRAQSSQLAQSNGQLYTEAQAYCERQNPVDFSGRKRVPCIEQYIQSRGVTANLAPIADSLYKFDFASATWSPDLAGWSLAATIVSLLLLAVSLLTSRWFKTDIA